MPSDKPVITYRPNPNFKRKLDVVRAEAYGQSWNDLIDTALHQMVEKNPGLSNEIAREISPYCPMTATWDGEKIRFERCSSVSPCAFRDPRLKRCMIRKLAKAFERIGGEIVMQTVARGNSDA